ncbi:putative proline dehydrogenase domain, proline oxidase family, FAD-linked oxidoreductase [Septoria linicola]|nr:putative proline dehydrogenase domain, proline oxidase family, FAD-linked oxidoreductase [Septoria linicola]
MATAMKSSHALATKNMIARTRQTTLSCKATATQIRAQHSGRRRLHSTSHENNGVAIPSIPASETIYNAQPSTSSAQAPLSCLTLPEVLRSYLITTMSSSPALLGASTSLLRKMLESNNPLFSLEKNPIMRIILWETFYKQFCAGADKDQIAKRCAELRAQGYSGVILENAREVLKDEAGHDEATDIAYWKKGMLDTINMAAPGDFLGLKWSGMGSAAMNRMAQEQDPSADMAAAMHAVSQAAAAKDIGLLPSAEETWNLQGFQNWSLLMQREYNTKGKSVVYTTYQMYLKQMPEILSKHLEIAKAEGFTLGAKLVRGAYLATEPRHLIHDTIQDTHNAYDSATAALINRSYDAFLRPATVGQSAFPDLNVVVASHNASTVEKAQALRQEQARNGQALTPMVYAQLQGMADEVSCKMLANAKAAESDPSAVREKVFKLTVWGTMHEALNYLLRRAAENKDAASRTGETRAAMGAELVRRMKAGVGLA